VGEIVGGERGVCGDDMASCESDGAAAALSRWKKGKRRERARAAVAEVDNRGLSGAVRA